MKHLTLIFAPTLVALVGMAQTNPKQHKQKEQYYMISAISQNGKTALGIYKIS